MEAYVETLYGCNIGKVLLWLRTWLTDSLWLPNKCDCGLGEGQINTCHELGIYKL